LNINKDCSVNNPYKIVGKSGRSQKITETILFRRVDPDPVEPELFGLLDPDP
jgi:hypothetical protein